MGLLIPLTAGDYDLSIASVLTLSSMIVALLNAQQGWPVGLAIVVAVAAGALAGLANGALVVLLRADSLVITLGYWDADRGHRAVDQQLGDDRRRLFSAR